MAQIANVNLNQLISSVSSVGEFSHTAYFNESLNPDEDDEIEEVEEILDMLAKKYEEAGESFFIEQPEWHKLLVWLLALCAGDSMEMNIHSSIFGLSTKVEG